jgi:glycosyltransferase involved in cell wall biosynthesis
MKILMVHNAYQEAGGEDEVFRSEKRLLESFGHRVVTYLRSNDELQNISPFQQIAAVPRTVWSSESRRRFAQVLDASCPDLVHIHNTFLVISPSIYSVCSDRRVPVVQTLHNFRLLCPGSSFYRDGHVCEECVDHGLLRSLRYGCFRESRAATTVVAVMLASHRKLDTWQRFVSRFITLTEFSRQKFIASGFSAQKIVVKPNFVDADPGEREGAGECALFVGRLHKNKGVHILLDAWSRLPGEYELQIVGDGPEREALEAQARQLNLSRVTFRGRLPRQEVIVALKNARFTVMPSTWYETFGMCIAESFACGTPVICSRLGAMAEIVADHRTGLHFHPGDPQDLADKVSWAWTHPEETRQMARAAREEFESRFTPEKNYSQLMQIYEETVNTYARPAKHPKPDTGTELSRTWDPGPLPTDI